MTYYQFAMGALIVAAIGGVFVGFKIQTEKLSGYLVALVLLVALSWRKYLKLGDSGWIAYFQVLAGALLFVAVFILIGRGLKKWKS